MQRCLFHLLVLGGLVVWLGSAGPLGAQSKKKLGGPIVELEGLKSQVFDFWKPQKAEPPYVHNFLLPQDLKSDKDSAELTIYPATGAADDIIADWKKRFEPPKGYNIDQVSRVEKFKVGPINVTKLNIQGTYLKTAKPTDSVSEAKKVDDQRMSAYVFEGKGKSYAIRLVGPFRTVGLHMPDLDTWVKAFK